MGFVRKWIEFCPVSYFEKEDRKRIDVEGTAGITVFKIENGYYAIEDACTHAVASLSMGIVDGKKVMCPLHGAAFDLESGKALSLPAVKGVRTFAVKIEQDIIFVKV